MRIEEFQIETENGERIDKYLTSEMTGFSRSYIQKLIKDGNVSVSNEESFDGVLVRTGGIGMFL